MPVGEFLDRFSIVTLKHHYLPEEVQKEFDCYWCEYVKLCQQRPDWNLPTWLQTLVDINNTIWGFESALRRGQLKEYDTVDLEKLPQEELLQLAAVGQAAINIRDNNKRRKAVVNCLVDITGMGHKDIKHNHSSQETADASSR